MKRNKVLLITGSAAVFLIFCLLSAFHGAQKIVQHNINRDNIIRLSSEIGVYRSEHGRCPPSLGELLVQSDIKTKNNLSQILHDRFNHHYEYQFRTNGFVIVVSSPDQRFAKGDHYLVEYEYTENDKSFHSLLKINGEKADETWIGESKSTTPK